jgi:hypothetical protein
MQTPTQPSSSSTCPICLLPVQPVQPVHPTSVAKPIKRFAPPVYSWLSDRFVVDEGPDPDEEDEYEYEEVSDTEVMITEPCKHVFGKQCLERWLRDHDSCPMCRTRVVR